MADIKNLGEFVMQQKKLGNVEKPFKTSWNEPTFETVSSFPIHKPQHNHSQFQSRPNLKWAKEVLLTASKRQVEESPLKKWWREQQQIKKTSE